MDAKESIIKELIKNILGCKMCDVVKDELYIEIKSSIKSRFKEFILSEDVKNMIYKLAEERVGKAEKENKTLKEILPPGFENSLKVLTYNKGPELTAAIKNFIADDKFKSKVKEEIVKFTSGVNPMIAKFINAENIYAKLMASITSYVDSPENMMNVVMGINNKIDEASGKNISEFTNYVPYEGKMSFVRAFVDEGLNFVADEIFIKSIEDKVENEMLKCETVGELLRSIGITEEKLSGILML